MAVLPNHKFIAGTRSETGGKSRFRTTTTGAVLLAMAINAAINMLPLSGEAQTSSAPQALTPQTAPAYPYQPPAAQGAYPYSYSYPYYYPYPNWAYGYPWGCGYPWGWGWPAAVSVGFGGCFNCGFRGAFFRPGFGRFGFGHRGFFRTRFGHLVLPMPALVAGSTVAAADNLT
jgi:hypothetical protein